MKAQDLKNSILQLAIQGKLVPQDAKDESAEVLFAKIQAEKQKLIKEDKIKKDKTLPIITDEEKTFEIPSTWKWVRLGDCADIYTGNSIPEEMKLKKYSICKEGYNYIGTKDVSFNQTINYVNGIKIPFDESKFKYAYSNTILLCIEGGSAGRKIGLLEEKVCFGNKLCAISAFIILPKFMFYFLQSAYFKSTFGDNTSGIIGGVSVAKFKEIILSLPPLEEQKRIVAKIEELEPFIKQYDEAETELGKLNNVFPEQLKKSILQYVLQAPDIENKPYILKEVISFGPKNGYSPKAVEYKTNIKTLTLTATTSGIFNQDCFKYVDIKIDKESYLWLKAGDILIQRGNSLDYVGISAIYDKDDNAYIYPDLMIKIRANKKMIDDDFLQLYLNAPNVREYYKKNASGTSGSMPKINHKTISNTPIIIPSVVKQKSVVIKVKKLLELSKALSNHCKL